MPRSKPTNPAYRPGAVPTAMRLFVPLCERSGPTVSDVRGTVGTISGATWANGPWGPELAFTASPVSGVSFGNVPITPDLTLLALIRLDATAGSRVICAKSTDATVRLRWKFTVGSAVQTIDLPGVNVSSGLPALPANGSAYAAVATVVSSGNYAAFYQITEAGGLASAVVATAASITSGAQAFMLGARQQSGAPADCFVGRIAALLWLDYAAPAAEVVRLLNSLWSGHFPIIRPSSRATRLGALAGLGRFPGRRLVGGEECLVGVGG
jgi:hypothetical protein